MRNIKLKRIENMGEEVLLWISPEHKKATRAFPIFHKIDTGEHYVFVKETGQKIEYNHFKELVSRALHKIEKRPLHKVPQPNVYKI